MNQKLKVFVVFAVMALILSACAAKENIATQKTQATSTPSVEPKILLNEDGEEYYPDLKPSEYIEDEDVEIEGRKYSYIKYAVIGSKIRIISLWSEDEELIIPSAIDSKKVSFLGGTESEMPKRLSEDGSDKLAWQKDETKKYKKIVIPEGVERIYDFGFRGVKAESIELPVTMYDTGKRSFIRSEVDTVIVKNKKMQISEQAFAYSTIKEIQLPSDYEGKLKTQCFEYSGLEKFNWPSGSCEDNIGLATFSFCKNLKMVIFPENQDLIYIRDFTFVGCTSLEELAFPASTKKVKYLSHPYADNYTKGGVKTLRFLGADTELDGCPYARGESEHEFITVGKIIAPTGAKAHEYAKKAFKIKSLSKKLRKESSKQISADSMPMLFNYSEIQYEKDVTLTEVEYEER